MCEISDISETGVEIGTEKQAPEGTTIEIELMGLGTVEARVVRQRKRVKGFAAEFVNLAEDVRDAIRSWSGPGATMAHAAE